MQITGSYTFEFERQAVWDILMNPDAIAKAIPGVQQMIPLDNETNAWRTTAKLSVASLNGTYNGVIRMSEIDAPRQYRLTVSGEGQQSVINGTALMTLEPDTTSDTPKTVVSWTADVNLSGKLASIAQRLVSVAASMLSRQFFGGLAKQLGASDVQQPRDTTLQPDS
jgi:uncharacterized protein